MELWKQCAQWLIQCRVLPPNHRVTSEGAQVCDLAQALRDGVLLCQLLNNLMPQAVNLREINLRPQMSQIPVIALVGNDACWTQISREQVPLLGSNVACALDYLDYHVVVEGLGGKGLLLTRQNEDQMDDIIRTAQSKCRNGQPILLNALIGKTTFREGSIAM